MQKRKMFLPLNLQLFAEEVETEEISNQYPHFEIEDDETPPPPTQLNEDGSIEIDLGEEESEEPEDEEQDEDGLSTAGTQREPEQEEVKQNDTAKAVIAERRKWKERLKALEKKASIAEKLMQSSGVSDIDEFQRQLDALESQRYQDQGLDPQTANMLVRQQRELAELKSYLNRQKYDVEAEKLKSDPFFADIDDWRDELEPLAERTGQTLEQAYMAVRGRERMKEFQREQEHRLQASQRKKQSARINTTTSGGAVKTVQKLNLTPEQLAIAKLAGMKPEEYAKYAKK
jgi:hypothetical protein